MEYGLDQQKRIEIHNLLVKSFASRRDILLKKMKIICFRHEKMESFEIIGDGKNILTVKVTNSADNILKMQNIPSGLISEVFLEVF